MQTFMRHRTTTEILADAPGQCLTVDTNCYETGSDFIRVTGSFAGQTVDVLFNTVNGWFFGRLNNGTEFNSDHDKHEDEEWFGAMLNFFYVPYGAVPAKAEPHAAKVAAQEGGRA